MTGHLTSPDRVSRARKAAADAGIDALLVTPGPDLRWLTGYDALPLERLTCLVLPADGAAFMVAPGLEVPAVLASPVRDLDVEVVGWGETDDPYAVIADRLGSPGAGRRWPTGCGPSRCCGCAPRCPAPSRRSRPAVIGDLRMRKTTEEVDALRRAGQAIDRVHARMAEFLRPGPHRARGRPRDRRPPSSTRATRPSTSSSSAPARTARRRTTRSATGCSRAATSSSSTSAARPPRATARTAPGCTPWASRPREFADYFRVLHEAQLAACAHARPGGHRRVGRRGGPGGDRRRRVRRAVHPPHRPRHRRRDPRGALHRRGQRDRARAGHGVLHRAGHLPARPPRRPHRGHRRRPPRTASSGSTSPTATTSCWRADRWPSTVTCRPRRPPRCST